MRKIKPQKSVYAIGGRMSKEEGKPQFPTIRIDLDHIPEAKKWKVGNDYSLSLNVKMVGLSQSKFQNEAEFEIREIEPEGEKSSDEDDGAEKDEE